MHNRPFNFNDLISQCLQGDQNARDEFYRLYTNNAFSDTEISTLEAELQIEAAKPDRTANRHAIFLLAKLSKLKGGAENLARAKALYERASELGNANAMNNLAVMLKHEGGADNLARAKTLYERASELGNAPAMYNLAVMLKHEGGTENLTRAAQLYRQSLLIDNDNLTKRDLLDLLNKTTDPHIQYHAYMLDMTDNKLPDDIIKLFNAHPEEVIRFMLTDTLLTPPQRETALEHIRQHYISLTAKADFDPTITLGLYNQIPAGTSHDAETLMEQSNILFTGIIDGSIKPELLFSTIQDVIKIDRLALKLTAEQLAAKNKLSSEESILLEQLTQVLAAPNKRISVILPNLVYNHRLSSQERVLHLYVGHRRKMEHYTKPLRKYLIELRDKLTTLAEQKATPSDLWQKGLPLELRLALVALKEMKKLPTTTNGVINLAAQVHKHLLADDSDVGRELVGKLPRFALTLTLSRSAPMSFK